MNEKKFCGQPNPAKAFQDLSKLIHGAANTINLLQEIKVLVHYFRNEQAKVNPNYKPLVRSSLHLNMPVH
jgi:hypothetical protein